LKFEALTNCGILVEILFGSLGPLAYFVKNWATAGVLFSVESF
jgi:hypothetical protein